MNKTIFAKTRLTLEPLEKRDLLAAVVSVDNGILNIRGTDDGETIEIRYRDANDPKSDVEVVITDLAGRWSMVARNPRKTIESLFVRAYAGNDIVVNYTTIGGSIHGDAGDDALWAGTSGQWLYGGLNNDRIYGNSGDDWLFGGSGEDEIYGAGGVDHLYGDGDRDTLAGGNGDDFLWGGGGADILYGQVGNDELHGGAGNDRLEGGIDNDFLYGDGGLDTLFGQGGADWLEGGYDGQADVLWGGTEADTFVEYWQQFVNFRARVEVDQPMDQGVFGHWQGGLFVIDGWDVTFQKNVTLDDWQG